MDPTTEILIRSSGTPVILSNSAPIRCFLRSGLHGTSSVFMRSSTVNINPLLALVSEFKVDSGCCGLVAAGLPAWAASIWSSHPVGRVLMV